MAPEIIRGEVYTIKAEIFSTAKSVQAIVPKHIRTALSPALFHATEHGLGTRTPSWSVFRAEVKDRRAAYRKEQTEKRKRRKFVRALLIAAAALGLVAIVYGGIAYADYRIRRIADAEANAARARIEYLLHKGKQHLTNGDYNDAIACFMAVKHNPNFCTNDYPNVDLDGAIQWCRERR